ncbi:glycosyltransferase [Leptothoe spongobia TAU-MAC 1115]|uniref:Glycosyltransferase n=2 Tax=Leptothoe TaxID=2651725 RepID=A0A947DCN1_9CYAN|nr:glycosyltransferase [Leptothoe spongobia TAU-MAC 1115]
MKNTNKAVISNKKTIQVCHSHQQWLNLTENWLYNQVVYLPPNINNAVLCDRRLNSETFSIPYIYSFSEVPKWRYFWDKGLRKLGFRNYLGYFKEIAQKLDVDIIHSHFGPRAWENLSIVKHCDAKHLVTFYGLDVNYLPRQNPEWLDRYQKVFQEIDGVLCEGSYMARCIVKMGCPKEKIRVHHLGVVLDKIPFRPRNWIPGETLNILIVASFREKKGIQFAIKALGEFQHKQDIKITIIGDSSSDVRSQEEKRKILSLIDDYKLTEKVNFLGFQPHDVLMAEAYKNHIFLSPSVTAENGDTEGGAPVSIIEMIASGMPVVSTEHCDIPEVAFNRCRSFLAKERDVDGLVTHLTWLVKNLEQWSEVLLEGRRYIEDEYDAKVQGKRLGNIYIDLLNR